MRHKSFSKFINRLSIVQCQIPAPWVLIALICWIQRLVEESRIWQTHETLAHNSSIWRLFTIQHEDLGFALPIRMVLIVRVMRLVTCSIVVWIMVILLIYIMLMILTISSWLPRWYNTLLYFQALFSNFSIISSVLLIGCVWALALAIKVWMIRMCPWIHISWPSTMMWITGTRWLIALIAVLLALRTTSPCISRRLLLSTIALMLLAGIRCLWIRVVTILIPCFIVMVLIVMVLVATAT